MANKTDILILTCSYCKKMFIRKKHLTKKTKNYNYFCNRDCSIKFKSLKEDDFFEASRVALKYKSRWDFQKNDNKFYSRLKKAGLLDKYCEHMEPKTNKFNSRLIYAFLFMDSYCYVGLTCDLKGRLINHLSNKDSQVYKHINTKCDKYAVVVLENNISFLDVSEREQYWFNVMKKHHKMLNKSKCGGLGAISRKWTKSSCLLEAKKYKTRTEFAKGNKSAYNACVKNGWLDYVCKDMKFIRKYWNIDNSKKEALKYKTRFDFQKGSGGCYRFCLKNNLLDLVCGHME